MVCSTGCPVDAISQTSERKAVIDQGKCTGCGACIPLCPRGAILPDSKSTEVKNEKDKSGRLTGTGKRPGRGRRIGFGRGRGRGRGSGRGR
jgi:Fe-S-cluster-containing hydrogenase component 2